MLQCRCCWDSTSKLYNRELVQDECATALPASPFRNSPWSALSPGLCPGMGRNPVREHANSCGTAISGPVLVILGLLFFDNAEIATISCYNSSDSSAFICCLLLPNLIGRHLGSQFSGSALLQHLTIPAPLHSSDICFHNKIIFKYSKIQGNRYVPYTCDTRLP